MHDSGSSLRIAALTRLLDQGLEKINAPSSCLLCCLGDWKGECSPDTHLGYALDITSRDGAQIEWVVAVLEEILDPLRDRFPGRGFSGSALD
jgi:hypothetical protein